MKDKNWDLTINAWDDQISSNEPDIEELSRIIAEWPNYIIERETTEQFLTIDETKLSSSDFSWDKEIEISWLVDSDIESIQVDFSNTSSDFPDDSYSLKSFQPGSTEYIYRASPLYKVLDVWENIYIFTAKSKNGESKTKLTIQIDQKDSDWENTQLNSTSGTIDSINFPKWDFGEVIILDETNAYYSDLKGLEISKTSWLSNIVCEAPEEDLEEWDEPSQHSITNFLLSRYNSWVYWNTCRPTVSEKWISFFVLRLLADESFSYEKHYLDYNNELHGVLELQTGTWVSKENIQEKNTEFKAQSYEITPISDALFKEIIIENRS